MLLDSSRPIYTAVMGDMPLGSVFAGHRIEAVAGRGGMGVVYRARQLSLDRVVALKVIAPALMADEAIRRRFLRESHVAASIDHPHVIPIYYAGEEAGVAYIAMRYVAGDDLRTLVRRTGPLEPGHAARIAGQVAAALDAAHATGLVHRDVKPANVLLGQGEHAYLSDFGLTKHVLSEAGATKPGHWVGTLDFIAPEQIRGERVDARADVYALGCVLHYMLAGRPPFSPEGEEAKMWAHLTEMPPAVSSAAPGVPGGFDEVIARALAKDPAERFQSAGDLGRAATAAAAGGRAAARDTVVATGAAAPIEIETRTAGTAVAAPAAAVPETQAARRGPRVLAVAAPAAAPPESEPARRGPRVLAAAAVGGVLLAVAAVGALAMRDEPGRGGNASGQPAPPPKPSLKVTSTRIGGRPNNVIGAEGRIWTGWFRSDRMVTLDPATGEPRRSPRPDVGVGLSGLALDGDTIWAVAARDRKLVHLDTARGSCSARPSPCRAQAARSRRARTPSTSRSPRPASPQGTRSSRSTSGPARRAGPSTYATAYVGWRSSAGVSGCSPAIPPRSSGSTSTPATGAASTWRRARRSTSHTAPDTCGPPRPGTSSCGSTCAARIRRRRSRRGAARRGSSCARAPSGSPTAPRARSPGSTSAPAARPAARSGCR